MRWIAPTERDAANESLERRLWAAADQLRANSGLTAQQYSQPVLGLIFLRFADARFEVRRAALKLSIAGSRRGSRLEDPKAYTADGVVYLPPAARFEHLLTLPEGAAVGQAVNEAMRLIERDNPQLSGVLPKTYEIFESVLLKALLKKVSEIPASLDYDAFGRIYEYFLGEFARTEGQRGGEFYTPSSIVRLLVEVLDGRILDPACGSGGMFVQSARFVAEHRKNPSTELSIHGQEKVAETARLCRMNLAVHGIEGDVKEGITYYDDLHDATGRFDFTLANPPFNVNAVDKERLASDVGPRRRFPFGLPTTDNANYLWIQLFYSALNERGRSGFVMGNSASDARGSEQEIRRQLIESRAVDVIIAVGPNMFYTVTLPVTLWFLDRGKATTSRADSILFMDARHIYRQIDRAHRDWTDAQISVLANTVRLYRGEEPDFTIGGDEAREKVRELFGDAPAYKDIPGFCKAADLGDVEADRWNLNPGRHVGVAPGESGGDEDLYEQLGQASEEFSALSAAASELAGTVSAKLASVMETVSAADSESVRPEASQRCEWGFKRLDEVCSSIQDGDWIETKDQGGYDFRLLQISNIGVGEFVETGNYRFISQETFDRLRCVEVMPGDILIARMPKPIGRAWLVGDMPWRMVTAVDVAIIRVDRSQLDPLFLTHFWNLPETLAALSTQASGTTRPRITRRDISAFKVPVPPREVQARFAALMEPQGALADVAQKQLQALRRLGDLLVPHLLSGDHKLLQSGVKSAE